MDSLRSGPLPRLDITVHGATGVTGRDMLVHLLDHAPDRQRLGISGRDPGRLDAVLAHARSRTSRPGADRRPVRVLVADNHDVEALDALARASRVLLDAAGPYADWVDPLLDACVVHGTHHLDLGGETFHVRSTIDRLHARATAAGVALVPLFGYESLPFDLAVWTAATRLHAATGAVTDRADVVVRFDRFGEALRPRNVLSAGSLGTFVNQLRGDDDGAYGDPGVLVPGGVRQDRLATPVLPRWVAWAGTWVGPLIPAPFLNTALVQRTATLAREDGGPFAPSFAYREGTDLGSVGGPVLAQRLAGLVAGSGYAATAALFRPGTRPLRLLAGAVVDRTRGVLSDGPTERAQEAMGFTLRALVEGTAEDGPVVATTTVAGCGHPGYRATARMAAAGALLLADRGPAAVGVSTPSLALGPDPWPWLAAAGLTTTGTEVVERPTTRPSA